VNSVIPAAGEKFLRRDNIELYFGCVVVERHDIRLEIARRTMRSLQHYTDDMEYIDGTEKFELESLLVKAA
jgi:hypothetical protein